MKVKLLTLVALPSILAGNALAAVPAGYTTAVEDMATDATTFITSTFGVLAGVAIAATLGAILVRKIKAGRSAA